MRVTLSGAVGGSLAARLAGAGAAFGLHAMLARLAGADHYGTYSYAIAWVGVLAVISTLGLDVALVKYVAAYHAAAQWEQLKGLVRWSHRVVLPLACVLATLLALVVAANRERIGAPLVHTFWIGCGVLPLTATLRLAEARLAGLRHVVLAQAADGILRPFVMAGAAVLAFGLTGTPLRSADVMGLHLVGLMLAAVAGVALLRRLSTEVPIDVSPRYDTGA